MITTPHFSGKISSRRETFSITIEVEGQSPEGSGSGGMSGERGQLTGEAGDPRNQGKDDGKRTGSQQEVQITPLNTHIRAHTHTHARVQTLSRGPSKDALLSYLHAEHPS